MRGVLLRFTSFTVSLFDTVVVDRTANGIADALRLGSVGLRRLQTGQVQVYGALAFVGLLVAGALVLLLNPL